MFEERYNPSLVNQTVNDKDYTRLISHVNKLSCIENLNDFWPSNLPEPGHKPTDDYGRMAFDLNCMSVAYFFLHEVQHVKLKIGSSKLSDEEEHLLS